MNTGTYIIYLSDLELARTLYARLFFSPSRLDRIFFQRSPKNNSDIRFFHRAGGQLAGPELGLVKLGTRPLTLSLASFERLDISCFVKEREHPGPGGRMAQNESLDNRRYPGPYEHES